MMQLRRLGEAAAVRMQCSRGAAAVRVRHTGNGCGRGKVAELAGLLTGAPRRR